jgi:hypothetical protein
MRVPIGADFRVLIQIVFPRKRLSKGNQGRLFYAGLDVPADETADNRSDKCVLLDLLPDPIDLAFNSMANALYITDRGDQRCGNTMNRIDLDTISKKKERCIRPLGYQWIVGGQDALDVIYRCVV